MKLSKKIITIFIIFSFLLFSNVVSAKVPDTSSQAIVVTTDDWNSVSANISLYEKGTDQKWYLIKKNIPAVIGRKGLGWGKGMFSSGDLQSINYETYKKEGDKKAPAGIFALTSVFGSELSYSAHQRQKLKMPYTPLKYSNLCISDNVSSYYNQIIDTNDIKKDWLNDNANEYMRKIAVKGKKQYKWGIFVEHNTRANTFSEPDKTSGSCIFIHIWKGEEIGTSGCTAMAEENLLEIIDWLDVSKNPVLIQLPKKAYQSLQEKWFLP